MFEESISTVKAVRELFVRQIDRNPGFATSWLERLDKLLSFLAEQKQLTAPIAKSLGDLSDLPEELLRELSFIKTDELEDQILTVMRACDGKVNLDQVLVGLYRKFKVVQTRRYLQNKMYRMWKKELVYQIPEQRASYSLQPQPQPIESEDDYSEDEEQGGFDGRPQAPLKDLDDDIPF